MAEERYVCKKCGAGFMAESEQGEPLDCSECGSEQIEKFIDALYARDYGDVRRSAEAQRMPKK
jgi:DNA-directed RNA polymerase subunit RPC12/RpoP